MKRRKKHDGGSGMGGYLAKAGVPTGGRLSPRWCEWFMGFPPGWTEV